MENINIKKIVFQVLPKLPPINICRWYIYILYEMQFPKRFHFSKLTVSIMCLGPGVLSYNYPLHNIPSLQYIYPKYSKPKTKL